MEFDELDPDQVRGVLTALPLASLEVSAGKILEEIEKQRALEIKKCSRDTWHFVRNYCRSVHQHFEESAYSGTAVNQTVEKFPDYPHVERTIKLMASPSNTLIEKSRDMMATWMICALFLHDLLFQEGCQLLMASRVFADVDDGGEESTPQSLLGRVRFMYSHLPSWIQSKYPLKFKVGQIQNQPADNVLVGMKAKRNTGRSGKYRRTLADEFGFWEYGESNLAAMRFGCQNGLILLSTPPEEGKSCAFGRLASTGAEGFLKIRLHWSDHPLRQGPMGKKWYSSVTASMTPAQIARELEIDYEGAIEGRVFPKLDRLEHELENIPYDPKFPLHLSFDHGLNEETCLFIQQRSNCPECDYPITLFIDEYQGGFAKAEQKQTVWENRDYIIDNMLVEEPYNFSLDMTDAVADLGFCTGDPAGKVDDVQLHARKTDDTRLVSYHTVYRQRGIRIRSKYSKVKDGLTLMRNALTPPCGCPHWFISSKCENFLDAAVNYRWKSDPADLGRFLDDPIKNWTAHWCDSARYWFVNTQNMARANQPKVRTYRQVWSAGSRYPKMVPVSD